MRAKQGVILCNLGTPSQPTARGVRQFLAPFLSDQRVVELPRILWLPLLYGVILPLRSRRVAKSYAEIWTDSGSPLQAITEQQCSLLAEKYGSENVSVAFAMTYGKPRLADVLSQMHLNGIENIVVLPLYPQYSATTTASLYDQWGEYAKNQRNLPSISFIKDYHNNPQYISALARSIKEARKRRQQVGGGSMSSDSNVLLFSFHGIPEVNVRKGDPYREQCERTAELVCSELGLGESQWMISFQSRFGKQEWLKPYTFEVLQKLGKDRRSVDVICPAFASDCLETLEEISIESRGIFIEAGGESFNYIPCLNASDDHIQLFYSLSKPYLLARDASSQSVAQ